MYFCPEDCFYLANCTDPDEIPPNDVWSTFVDSIYVYDCHLSGMGLLSDMCVNIYIVKNILPYIKGMHACTYTLSDQWNSCSLTWLYESNTCYVQVILIQAHPCNWANWFASDQVPIPKVNFTWYLAAIGLHSAVFRECSTVFRKCSTVFVSVQQFFVSFQQYFLSVQQYFVHVQQYAVSVQHYFVSVQQYFVSVVQQYFVSIVISIHTFINKVFQPLDVSSLADGPS